MVAVDAPTAPVDPRGTFDGMVKRLERRHGRALLGASYWNQPDAVVEKLPEDLRNAAYAARRNKKEAPVGLSMAHEYVIVKARMDAIKASRQNLSISIGGVAVIQLPPQLPPPIDAEVVVLNPEDDNAND